jgi:GAF domain-containing protein
MDIGEFEGKFGARLTGLPPGEERVELAAVTLCKVFKVKPEEVAIFAMDGSGEALGFLWPKQLRTAGSVPISAHQSLVVRTVESAKAHVDNSFAATQHVSIFEHFRRDSSGMPIQKIISAPVVSGGVVKGVIQVSRKGETREAAGDDFTAGDLAVLVRLAGVIAPAL